MTTAWRASRENWKEDRAELLFYRAIGDQIRERRRLHGWSQQTLGAAAGLTGPTIGMIESGRIRATLYNVVQRASALHCLPSDLLPR